MAATINIVFDREPGGPYYEETLAAVHHAIDQSVGGVALEVVHTSAITPDFVTQPGQGVVIGPGTPYGHPDRAEAVIRSCRERGIPLVGT